MKSLLSALLLCGAAAFASAQTSVSDYVPGAVEDGVVYFLPKTALQVDIEIEKKTYKPGEFARYGERYLGLKDVVAEGGTEWTMKKISLKQRGVPDKEKAYFIKYKDNTSAVLVSLSEEGILQAINTRPQAKDRGEREDVGGGRQSAKKTDVQQYMTQEILMANSTAKKAELIANEIYSIRESRNLFLRGEADNMPGDNESLTIILSKLDEQEKALTELFTGTVEVEDITYTVDVIPEGNLDAEPIFRFSKAFGVVDSDDLCGEPVYMTVEGADIIPEPAEVEEKKKSNKYEGVIYNIPGMAHVSLFTKDATLIERDVMIAQFGTTEVLTNNLFNKKTATKVLFDDSNGGLVRIERE